MMQPAPAEVRREARRRVYFGFGGLLLMLLLVLLAGLLTGQARQEAEVAKAQAEAAGVANPGGSASVGTAAPATEPFGDISADPGAGPMAPAADEGVVVPDLQPDPKLAQPAQRP
jgi:uncharacterized SAM-binding protein YcdF (DUF218 family)